MPQLTHVSRPARCLPGKRAGSMTAISCPRLWCLLIGLVLGPMLSVCAQAAPSITITSLPSYGTLGLMCGTVAGVDHSQYRVSSFLYVPGLGWYRKPYDDAPTVPINPVL